MSLRHGIALVGLVGLLLVQPAFSQPGSDKNPSHIPIQQGDPRKLQEMLAKRLQFQKLLNDPDLLKLASEVMKDPNKFGLKDQLDKFKKDGSNPDLNDPAWRDLLGKILDPKADPNTPGKNLIPRDKQDILRKFFEENAPQRPKPPTNPVKPAIPENPSSQPKPPETSPPPVSKPPEPKEPIRPPISNNKPSSDKYKWMADLAEKARKNKWAMNESPAWRQFVRDVNQTVVRANKVDSAPTEKAASWVEKFPNLSELIPTDKLPKAHWPQMNYSWMDRLGNVKFGSAPPVAGPWNGPTVADANVNGPSLASGLWVILGVGFIAVAIVLMRMPRGNGSDAKAPTWRLGPWPVDPKTVRTREEVIKAFEHLSLLRLGLKARTWHHRQIAGQFPEPSAAERVAEAYEKARYTPEDEAFTEGELAVVRQDLSHLAGVPTP